MVNLTTKLENLAVGWLNQARLCREQAAQIRAQPRANDFDEYNRVHIDLPAKQEDEKAAMHERRAVEARKGLLLIDADDIKWGWDNNDLVAECARANRVIYASPVAGPQMLISEAAKS